MNDNLIVFNLEGVLIKNGEINKAAIELLKVFVKIGWRVYIQSEEGKLKADRFIESKRLKEVIGLKMWQKGYHFDITVCDDFQTGPIYHPVPGLNTSVILNI